MNELTVISPPAGEALSLVAAKDYLRIGHEGEDASVSALIGEARARLEAASGLALVSRVLQRVFAAWSSGVTRGGATLRPGPVRSLVSVEVVDADGGRELVTGRFVLDGERLCLRPFHALPPVPEGGHVAVTFEAGFGAVGDVPEDLVHALKRLVLQAYSRGDASGLPQDVEAVLTARRAVRI